MMEKGADAMEEVVTTLQDSENSQFKKSVLYLLKKSYLSYLSHIDIFAFDQNLYK